MSIAAFSHAARRAGRGAVAFALAASAALAQAAEAPPSTDPPASAAAVPAAFHAAAEPQGRRPDFRHITSTDVWRPDSFWFTNRPNVVDEPAVDAWDPTRIINTDRPDYTDVATVVGHGVVQIETGFSQLRKRDAERRVVTDAFPNALFRIGHGDRFEYRVKVRGHVRSEVDEFGLGAQGVAQGFGDVELGFKWVLGEQEDWLPMQTIVGRAQMPTGEDDVSANRVEPGVSYIYNWQVRRWWFFRGATGVDFANQPAYRLLPATLPGGAPSLDVANDRYVEFSQAFSSYVQVSRRVGMFAEWFMFKRHGSLDDHSDHIHNYGLYLYLTPDVQIDGRIGWRIGDHLEEALYGLGFSVRF